MAGCSRIAAACWKTWLGITPWLWGNHLSSLPLYTHLLLAWSKSPEISLLWGPSVVHLVSTAAIGNNGATKISRDSLVYHLHPCSLALEKDTNTKKGEVKAVKTWEGKGRFSKRNLKIKVGRVSYPWETTERQITQGSERIDNVVMGLEANIGRSFLGIKEAVGRCVGSRDYSGTSG